METGIIIFIASSAFGYLTAETVTTRFAPALEALDLWKRLIIVVAGFALLAGLIFVIQAGVDALPGDNLYRIGVFLTSKFLAQAALGVIAGLILSQWIRILRDPDRLSKEHIRIAHRRWGFSLLVLVLVGGASEVMVILAENLTGVQTPIGSISLSVKNEGGSIETVSGNGVGSNRVNGGYESPADKEWIKGFRTKVDLDDEMINFLLDIKFSEENVRLGDIKKKYDEDYRSLSKKYYEDILSPDSPITKFSVCLAVFRNVVGDIYLFRDMFNELFVINSILGYRVDDTQALRGSSKKVIDGIRARAEKTVGGLVKDLSLFVELNKSVFKHKKNDQESYCDVLNNPDLARNLIEFRISESYVILPYGALIVAKWLNIYGFETASKLELIRWLDIKERDIRSKESNDLLDQWYLIKVYNTLGNMLQDSGEILSFLDIGEKTGDLMRDAMRKSEGLSNSLKDWKNNCNRNISVVELPPRIDDEVNIFDEVSYTDNYLESLFMITLVSVLDAVNSEAAIENREDRVNESTVAEARHIVELHTNCYRFLGRYYTNLLRAQFVMNYGIILATAVRLNRIAPSNPNEQKKLLLEAKNTLSMAVEMYREFISQEKEEIRKNLTSLVFSLRARTQEYDIARRYLRSISAELSYSF